MSWADVDVFLCQRHWLQPSNIAALLGRLETFVAVNEDPGRSPYYKNQHADSLDRLVSLLKDPGIEQHPGLALAALKALKILSRKTCNHSGMRRDEKKDGNAIQAVLRFLQAPGKVDESIAAEAANVLMNPCFEKENVEVVLLNEGCIPPMVAFLGAADENLQANVAGVLQSVRTGALGALHNISSDPCSTGIIRRKNGIPPIMKLLRSPQAAIAQSAAGALQNVSREGESRRVIRRDNDAVVALFDMLVDGKEVRTQVSAVGALMNILGPELAEKGKSSKEEKADRKGFARIITSCLVMGMAYDGFFGAGGAAASVR
ncbi:hypothetical protein KFL_000350280 [Klebsormidium nitens]|uniref:Uncharacterized protein n=1 Tax=Klebsormidium nitens TaxID=105231 RepID=A0A1Y1HM36_KLENI|nr:hypothetical protein KFL_000350280 [Klebsormidium nitens]|eukprot:GAQ79674.1 hypothetical protein KFL_000350280 [Klebsormidium nitens]